jgi:hypothetical protein
VFVIEDFAKLDAAEFFDKALQLLVGGKTGESGGGSNEVLGIIADDLSKAGWSLGWVSTIDSEGGQFVSWMHIETTESVLSCTRMRSLPRSLSWKGRFVCTC